MAAWCCCWLDCALDAELCLVLSFDDTELCRWLWFVVVFGCEPLAVDVDPVLVGCDPVLVGWDPVFCGCDPVLCGCDAVLAPAGWLKPDDPACDTEPCPRKSPPKPPRLKPPEPPPWKPPPPKLPPRACAGATGVVAHSAMTSALAKMALNGPKGPLLQGLLLGERLSIISI